MLETSNDVLLESLSEAFEVMAYMVVIPYEEAPCEEYAPPTEFLKAEMDFAGPVSGSVEIWAGRDFTQALTLNIMGIEDQEEAARKNMDALKELLNTTCGVLLPRLATDESDVFDVSVPQGQSCTQPGEWQKLIDQPDVILLNVDEFLVVARLNLDKQ